MYQLEVKKWLVAHRFSPSAGWDVTIDIDAMERANGGRHPDGKREIAIECEASLRESGCRISAHELYGRADLVAKSPEATFVVEVEGDSSRQTEQAMYSAIGQIVLSMRSALRDVNYAIAVPDSPKWERHVSKVPKHVCDLLRLKIFMVSPHGVREL
jgi:hypothetical protein